MLHAGLDLSRKRLDVCLLSEHGELVEEFSAPPDADGLRGLVRHVGQHGVPVRGVIESMTDLDVGYVNQVRYVAHGAEFRTAARLARAVRGGLRGWNKAIRGPGLPNACDVRRVHDPRPGGADRAGFP
jgi:hypothetical protein